MVNMFTSDWCMTNDCYRECDSGHSFQQRNIDEQILQYPLLSKLFHPCEADASTTPSQKTSPRDWTIQGTSHLPVPACSTAPDKIAIEVASPRPIEDCAYRLSIIFESPSIGSPSIPTRFWSRAHPLTRSPAWNGGTRDLEWPSAEGLSTPASDRPFEYWFLESGYSRLTNDR